MKGVNGLNWKGYIMNKTNRFSWGPFILTLIADGMVVWVLYHTFEAKIPEENQRVVDILIGNIMMGWIASRAYWFNTTFGSQAKDKTIANSAPVGEVK